jgi:hypothetical protein
MAAYHGFESRILSELSGNTGMFRLKLLINFLSLSIAGQIDWHAPVFQSTVLVLKAKKISRPCSTQISQLASVLGALLQHFCIDTLFGTPGGTTIVMTSKDNSHVLNVPYEELPDEDKDFINNAMEQYQDKCLLAYSRNRVAKSSDAWTIRFR